LGSLPSPLVKNIGLVKKKTSAVLEAMIHTTAKVDYSGLYPKVTGPSGASIHMSTPLSTGACNSCHGASTGKIGID
jgi:hypothetical protein